MRVSKADGSQATDLLRDALQLPLGVVQYSLRGPSAIRIARGCATALTSLLKAFANWRHTVVWKLDRSDATCDISSTRHDLTGRGHRLKVLTGHGAAHRDTTTAAGKLSLASRRPGPSFERELIAERNDAWPSLGPARAGGKAAGRSRYRRQAAGWRCGNGQPRDQRGPPPGAGKTCARNLASAGRRLYRQCFTQG